MGILSKLFGGGSKAAAAPPASESTPVECPHLALVPRWDSAEDMGKSERISHYYCEGCKSDFSPAEAEAIRAQGTTL